MEALTLKQIEKLRKDFDLVADDRVKRGDWTKEEVAEFGEAIKEAVDQGDVVALCGWAMWFSDLAHSLTTFALIVRNAEIRIRAAALEAKEQKKAA
jgi:N-acetylglucosamine kinase-like BadF-type ATPase